MEAWFQSLLVTLSLPQYGLTTVFVVALVSATLLPMGSEFAVYGLVKLSPELFWPTMVVATLGNTMGGAITWWMGYGAESLYERLQKKKGLQLRALQWLQRFGARACLLSWLPIVGDPLCAIAGWLKLPFWPCVGYMAVGKFLRFVIYTAAGLWLWPGQFNP